MSHSLNSNLFVPFFHEFQIYDFFRRKFLVFFLSCYKVYLCLKINSYRYISVLKKKQFVDLEFVETCHEHVKKEKPLTSKSVSELSEALILELVNPQYDERLFIEFPEKYKFRTCCVQILFLMSKQKNNFCTQRVP